MLEIRTFRVGVGGRPKTSARLAVLLALAVVGCVLHVSSASAYSAPNIYWADQIGQQIGEAHIDGTGQTSAFADSDFPSAVAVGASQIVWTDLLSGAIGIQNLDGSQRSTSFINSLNAPGLQDPDAVAIAGSQVYWVDDGTGTIGVATVDETQSGPVATDVDPNLITGLTQPTAIAIVGSHIYWTAQPANPITFDGEIGVANIDGTDVNPSLIQTVDVPAGIAVDSSHIYWSDSTSDSIGVANVDGTDANTNFIDGLDGVSGLALDDSHIYWADPDGSIGEANLDGTDVNPNLITDLTNPLSVAVSVPEAQIAPAAPTAFPATSQGTLSAPQTLTITNSGQTDLTVNGLTFTGPDPGDFIVSSNSCLAPVAPNESCQITVNFAPQATGARSATLDIATNDIADSPLQVQLSGTGSSLSGGLTGPQGLQGDTGSAGSDGTTGPTGPAGPNGGTGPTGSTGSTGAAGPVGATGAPGPAGKIELVTCTTTKPKKGKAKTTCKTRLVSGTVKFNSAIARTASLRRANSVFATGTAASLGRNRVELVLDPQRKVGKGRYTLSLTTTKRGHHETQRTSVTIH